VVHNQKNTNVLFKHQTPSFQIGFLTYCISNRCP